jgi:hypothetical protein
LNAASAPLSPLSVTVTANGYLTRETQIRHPHSGALSLDLIQNVAPFDLAFYRQLARNGLESTTLDVLRPWATMPRVYIATNDDTGQPLPPETLQRLRTEIPRAMAAWTAGRFTNPVIETGPTVKPKTDGYISIRTYREHTPIAAVCGATHVGPPSTETWFVLDRPGCSCGSARINVGTIAHEIGHVMGVWHVNGAHNIMNTSRALGACAATGALSSAEQHHARLVYGRPFGNQDVDRDPATFAFLRPDTYGAQPFAVCQ